jgi:hypothetical protein
MNFNVAADIDTRDASPIWVASAREKLPYDGFKALSEQIRAIGGYYSRFKHGFIFKEDPTEKLKGIGETPTASGAASAVVNAHGVKTGDIFYVSWGWEQTNVDYFQVVKATAKTATVREIGKATEETGFMSGYATPKPGEFLSDAKMSVTKTYCDDLGGVKPRLRNVDGHGHIGYAWDGAPVACSWYG